MPSQRAIYQRNAAGGVCITSVHVGCYLHSEASHLDPDVTDFTVGIRHSSDRGMVGVFTCGRGQVAEIKYLSHNMTFL